MSFQVTARTILQLGAELISSDEVAFYELIKNAIDAQSETVEINILIRLPYNIGTILRAKLIEEKKSRCKTTKDFLLEVQTEILMSIDRTAPQVEELEMRVRSARVVDDLLDALEEANLITIKDTGEGMSLQDLKDVYLTIGTRSRFRKRQEVLGGTGRPILGEKGVGRLSTMRLGRRLSVKTSRHNEPRWNILKIDWSRFSHESDELIQDVKVAPEPGDIKPSRVLSGTLIRISGLTSEWTLKKVRGIVENEFSKFADPFVSSAKYPIDVFFNGEQVLIPSFDKSIFKYAHATANAEFKIEQGNPKLTGKVNYRLREVSKSFYFDSADLVSTTRVDSLHALHCLGPFKVQIYWYNRSLLNAASGISDYARVKKLVNQWAGGLMLYRDGFRVNPYGSPDDDWLNLDRKALASSGYKVNRRQIIGKVEISSVHNPQLVDQTNREGLRESDEKRTLVKLLQYVLEVEMRAFMTNVDRKLHLEKQLVNFDELEERVEHQEMLALRSLQRLIKNHPEVKQDAKLIASIREAIKKIQELMAQAKVLADSYERGREEIVHLASLGLMVEILAHELNRAVSHTLATLTDTVNKNLPPHVESLFNTLESQMKTLRNRLRVLDPLSTSGRNRKETFDLVAWVKEILSGHDAQFERHNIKLDFRSEPYASATLRVKAVKGMFVQILENLISNSVYWLEQQRKIDKRFAPKISVVIDTDSKEIYFTDNGPGIAPSRKEEIFQPYVTTKPSGEGKGLGLYVSREVAVYNGAKLYLSEQPYGHSKKLHTFVLALEAN